MIYRYHRTEIPGAKKSATSQLESYEDEALNLSIEVYPNPSKGEIRLMNFSDRGQIVIFDPSLRIIYSNNNYSGEVIDLSNQSNGIYFIRIINNEGQIDSRKLILSK